MHLSTEACMVVDAAWHVGVDLEAALCAFQFADQSKLSNCESVLRMVTVLMHAVASHA